MSAMQRRKGATGELELARELSRLFGVTAERSQQHAGNSGDCDVRGLPGIHVESKRCEALRLYPAMDQATADACEGSIPFVCHRKNGREWLAVVRLEDLPALVAKLATISIDSESAGSSAACSQRPPSGTDVFGV